MSVAVALLLIGVLGPLAEVDAAWVPLVAGALGPCLESPRGPFRMRVSATPHDAAWDAFLASTPDGHHAQTSSWGQLKASLGWRPIRILATDGATVVGGVQVLLKQLPISRTIAYVPKGPSVAARTGGASAVVLDTLREVLRDEGAAYVVVQPPHDGWEVPEQLTDRGFLPSSLAVFPTATVVIDLRRSLDAILAGMKPQTRRNIRLGERRGIRVRAGSIEDLPAFHRVLSATGRRQGFSVYGLTYYQTMARFLAPHGHFKLFLAEYRGDILAAMLAIPFGRTVTFKRGGWSGEHGDRHPNEIMHWTAIQWARAAGYHYYDFEGIEPEAAAAVLRDEPLPDSLRRSVSRFKLGFSRQCVIRPGVFDQVTSPAFRWARRLCAPVLNRLPQIDVAVRSLTGQVPGSLDRAP